LSQLRDTARQEATKIDIKWWDTVFQPYSVCVEMFVREIRLRYAAEIVRGTTQLFLRNFAKHSESWLPSQSLFCFLHVTWEMATIGNLCNFRHVDRRMFLRV
jgi:hypothetical protein